MARNADTPRIGLAAFNHGQAGYGGGLDIFVRQYIEALADHDHTTAYVVITRAAHAASWQQRAWPTNFSFYALTPFEPRQPLPVRLARRWQRWRGQRVPAHYGDGWLVRQLAALNLDLLHFPDTYIDPLTITVPCLLTVFDIQQEYFPEFFTPEELAWRAAHYRPSVDKAVHLIAPSRFTRQSLMEKYDVPAEKLSYVPAGARLDLRPADPAEVARVRARYSLPEQYIYYPANPWPHKNHARLLAALRLYAESYGPPPTLVLTGRLHTEPRDAHQLALAAGVEQHVCDLGFVDRADVPALYTGATALVFPSLFEGFGLPLLEAMAYGCPVAAANATTIPELVGEAALLFDPLDPVAIAAALHQLLSDADLRASLRAKGFARLPAYDWAPLVSQLTALYHRLARSAA